MTPSAHLVLIETAGNQRHIYATNKLRENIGASEQILRVGQDVVFGALRAVGGPDISCPRDACDMGRNPPLEDPRSTGIELWYAASGKALMLVKDREKGRAIVREITRTTLRDHPGVAVRGAVTREACPLDAGSLMEAVEDVHRRLESRQSLLPPAESRFQRLPVVAPCRNSGLPASGLVEGEPASAATTAKRDNAPRAQKRLNSLCPGIELAHDLNEIEKVLDRTRYIAVIHADGNGVGQIFQDFAKHSGSSSGRDLIDRMRRFSLGLDACTTNSFRAAIEELAVRHRDFAIPDPRTQRRSVLMLPLILGGDDLTVLCDARWAVPFTAEFLKAFENEVAKHPDVEPIAASASGGVSRLGMCAGIAVIKPHFPFFAAYRMSEGLLKSAKEVKNRIAHADAEGKARPIPCAAFDFHVHHSSSGDDLDVIREELDLIHPESDAKKDGMRSRLWGGPYIVTPEERFEGLPDTAFRWAKPRLWLRLQKRHQALLERDDDGRRSLPSSQLHELRGALFDGPAAVDAKLKLIRHRYEDQDPHKRALVNLLEGGESAYWADERDGKKTHVSGLLDAMALAKIDGGE